MALKVEPYVRRQGLADVPGVRINPAAVAAPYAAISAAAEKAGDAVEGLALKMQRARDESDLAAARTEATRQLDDLDLQFYEDPDYRTHVDRFDERSSTIKDELAGRIESGDARRRFSEAFDNFQEVKRSAIKSRAIKREHDAMIGTLDTDLGSIARQAATARNDVERYALVDQGIESIENLAATGVITQQNAAKRKAEFRGDIDEQSVRSLIIANPTLAIAALKDADRFGGLDPIKRVQLQDQAETRKLVLENRAEAQVKAAAAKVGDELDDIEDILAAGFDPGEARMEATASAVARLAGTEPGAALSKRAREIATTASHIGRMRTMTPADAQQAVADEETRLRTLSNVSKAEVDRLAASRKLLTTMRTEVKRDPLGWANRTGIRDIAPLTLQGEAALPSMAQRRTDALAVATYYGEPPRFLTDEEAGQLSRVYTAADADGRLQIAASINTGFGRFAPEVFKEITRDSAVGAHAAGLTTLGAAHVPAARAAFVGEKAMKDGNNVLPQPTDRAAWTDQTVGGALGQLPATRAALLDTAAAIYTARALQQGITKETGVSRASQALWKRSIQEAAGAVFDHDGEQWGGLGEYRGARVLIPASIRADDFEKTVRKLSDAELKAYSVGGGPARDARGRDLKADQLDDVWLVSAGHGRYYVSSTDPTDGPALLMAGTGPGGLYVLDMTLRHPARTGGAGAQAGAGPATEGAAAPAAPAAAPQGLPGGLNLGLSP